MINKNSLGKISHNVLYISYDGLTDPLGQSQILPYLIGLCSKGHSFHIISFEKSERFKKERDVIFRQIEDSSITWHPLPYHKYPPIVSTIYDILVMSRRAKQICVQNSIELIHCRSYIPMLIGQRLKKQFNAKLLFDMRGFWADERVDGQIWNTRNLIFRWVYQYFKEKEIQFCHGADHIISLTEAGKLEMVKGTLFNRQLKIPEKKISVIPCAVDLALFDQKAVELEDVTTLRSQLRIDPSDQVMIYLGSIGTWYLVSEMLEFYVQWKQEYTRTKFLWVTKDDIAIIEKLVKELDLDTDDLIYASASRHEVPVYLKLADVGIMFIKPAYSKKASSAVKMGEMMAMGLPFYYNDFGDAVSFLGDQQSVNVFPMEDIYLQTKNDITLVDGKLSLRSGVDKYHEVYTLLK